MHCLGLPWEQGARLAFFWDDGPVVWLVLNMRRGWFFQLDRHGAHRAPWFAGAA